MGCVTLVQKLFRFKDQNDKRFLEKVLKKIADTYEGKISISGDTLIILAKAFEEGIETFEMREIPQNVQATLNQISCEFIKYETDTSKKDPITGYFCYEDFGRKKKPMLIGSNDSNVLYRCNSFCEKSKRLAKEKIVQGILLKRNIHGLLELREILINLTHDSRLAQIYLCKANLLEEHQIIISADGIHLQCPLEKDESVSVMDHCYNQVDPVEMNPPCKYLIDPYISVNIEASERETEIIKDLAQLNAPEKTPEPKPKTVDVEVKEVEEKGGE